MNTIWRLILFSLITSIASAQSTTVSATVVDQSSVTWTNGSWALDFVPNPNAGSPPYWNGNPFPSTQWHYGGALDASGHFSQSVPSNSFITPSGSTYTITVCPDATAPCSTIIRQTFQGTSMDISSVITVNTQAISVKPGPLAVAYNDTQVSVQPTQVGYFYMNSTSQTPRYWNGLVWSPFGGTVNTITLSNLNPLFTTTAGGTATAPTFTFTAQTVSGNTVYGNCTVSSGLPSFCTITNAMLPGTLTANTSGNAATASALAATTLCGTTLFSKGIAVTGTANCVQPSFTDLQGNIAINQMNGGTGASSSTYWRGDNTWAALPTIPKVQSASAAGCTTGSSSYSACPTTVTFSPGFADSSYQVSCQGNSPSDSRAYLDGTLSKTATAVSVQTVTGGSVAVSYTTIDCIAVHP